MESQSCNQQCPIHCNCETKTCKESKTLMGVEETIKNIKYDHKTELYVKNDGELGLRSKVKNSMYDYKAENETKKWVKKDSPRGQELIKEVKTKVQRVRADLIKFLKTHFDDEDFDDVFNLDRVIVAIRDVQAGKRKMAIEYMKQCLSIGRSVIFFTSDLSCYVNTMKTTIKAYSINLCDINIRNVQSIIDDLNNDGPKVICLNGNDIQLKRALEIVEGCHQKMNIIFDEIDDIVGLKSARGKTIKKLVKAVDGRIIGLTATPFLLFWCNDILGLNIYGGDIMFKDSPVDHVKFGDETFRIIINDHRFKSKGFMTQDDKDYIDSCVEQFTEHKFDKGTVKGALINPGMNTTIHDQIKNYLLEKYPNSFVVLANGDNDKVYNVARDMNGSKYEAELTKTLSSIHDMWTSKDKYVFVIGCHKVGRSVSLRGELNRIPDSCFRMLMLTNHIYQPSVDIDLSNMYQGALRLQGVYPGEKPELILFTSQRVATSIEAYRAQIISTNEAYKEAFETLVQEGCPDVSEEFYKFDGKTSKPYTACKAPHKYYKFNEKIFPTLESKLAEQEANPNRPTRQFTSPVCSRILQILREADGSLTAEEIYGAIDTGDWTFTSITPVANIRKECLRMVEGGILNREGTPFKYSLV